MSECLLEGVKPRRWRGVTLVEDMSMLELLFGGLFLF